MTFADIAFEHHVVGDGRGGRIPTPDPVTQAVVDALGEGFEPRDGDIMAVTYPKAGTAWIRQIVHLLTSGGEQGDSTIETYVPYLEGTDLAGIDDPVAHVARLRDRPAPRVFATHLPFELLPGVSAGRARFVYLARHPKDCAISFFHFITRRAGPEAVGPWPQFLEQYLDGRVHYGSVFDHMLRWWEAARARENILFLTYAGLQRDLPAAVRRVADFAGIDASDALVEAVVAQSRFSAMKRNPRALPARISSDHLRRGTTGDWRSTFTPDQSAAFDARCRQAWAGSKLLQLFGIPGAERSR